MRSNENVERRMHVEKDRTKNNKKLRTKESVVKVRAVRQSMA